MVVGDGIATRRAVEVSFIVFFPRSKIRLRVPNRAHFCHSNDLALLYSNDTALFCRLGSSFFSFDCKDCFKWLCWSAGSAFFGFERPFFE